MSGQRAFESPTSALPEGRLERFDSSAELSGPFSGPLYEQVRERILSRIESGTWRAGTPIPPEVQLSRDFGVSVGTVRKALDQLARDRVLVRERGRGTFVKDGAPSRSGLSVRLATEDGKPIDATITLAATEYSIATPAEAAALRMLKPASIVPRALKLRREWRKSGKLLCLETITVDAARFPNLQFEVDPAADAFFQTYADKYHTVVDRTQWAIKPLSASDPRAATLRTSHPAAIVMRSLRTAFDARDLPLEQSEQLLILEGDVTIWSSQ